MEGVEERLQALRRAEREEDAKLFDVERRSQRILSQLEALDHLRPQLDRIGEVAQQLHERLSTTANSASRVSAKVRELDEHKQRVADELDRATDIVDLKECFEGTQTALDRKDYEQAAVFLHRYLSLNQEALAASPDHRLDRAREDLLHHLRQQCTTAREQDDDATFKKWLKYFPMIHAHEEGLQQVLQFLRQRILTKPKQPGNGEEADTESDTQFVNRVKKLLNRVALEIEGFLSSIDTHFGPGFTYLLLSELQPSTDACALEIVDEFVGYRQLEAKSQLADDEVEPQEVDTVASELAFMIQPLALYMRFVHLRAETDVQAYLDAKDRGELRTKLPGDDEDQELSASSIQRNSKLCRRMDELNAFYVVLEQKFLASSINLALCEDEVDVAHESPVTKAVEDVLFICQKCTRRAFLTVSEVTVSSTLNHVGTCLIEDLLSYLEQRMLSAANKHVDSRSWQGKLQKGLSLATGASEAQADDENNLASLPRHVWVNDLQLFLELLPKYKTDTLACHDRFASRWSTQEHQKLLTVIENNVQEAREVGARYLQIGVDKLAGSSVSSKLKGLINALPYASFALSESDFDDMDDATEEMYSLAAVIDTIVAQHKDVLLPDVFSLWAGAFTEKIATALEIKIVAGRYNLLGGLQLEKDTTELTTRISDAVQWPVTDRFRRINRMCLLLTLDRVHAVYDYYDATAANWNLSPDEIVSILSRRVDFDEEDVRKLKI